MLNQSQLNKICSELDVATENEDYITSFRHNMDLFLSQKGITLQEISNLSDVPMSTLKTFMYGENHDCKLSTAIKLAKTFGISVDELVGCNTLNENERKCVQISRSLPQSFKNYIIWAINFYSKETGRDFKKEKVITVLTPDYVFGDIKMTNDIHIEEADDVPTGIIAKSFMSLKMPCDNYMPKYSEGDVLMVANDRNPYPNEDSLIYICGNLYLAKRKVEDGIAKYFSIRDNKFRIKEDEVDEVLGYICYTIKQ